MGMNEHEANMTALTASLEGLDEALGEFQKLIAAADDKFRDALVHLDADDVELNRLGSLALDWLSQIDVLPLPRAGRQRGISFQFPGLAVASKGVSRARVIFPTGFTKIPWMAQCHCRCRRRQYHSHAGARDFSSGRNG